MERIKKLGTGGYSKNRVLPDSSVIINGRFADMMRDGTLFEKLGLKDNEPLEIILSRVVIAEMENRANQDKTEGIVGVEMLNEILFLAEKFTKEGRPVRIIPYGNRPSLEQIKLNTGGELDAVIRAHAEQTGAVLISSDRIQSDIARIEQIPVIYIEYNEEPEISGKRIQDFFDEGSMSVHLKAGCVPMAKRGTPGRWQLVPIGNKKLNEEEIKEIERNIIAEAENDANSFIEKELEGVTVVQLKNYRIVICRPPFSDAHEITAVKPLVKLTLDDYNINDAIKNRLAKAEGILVAGSPGAGKSTFISALAEFYLSRRKLVKTLESVRDLQVPPEVSQYSDLEGDFEKTADILLLVRPDYTIYDEIRTSEDFKIFADMRLAGVGMVGVIHASSALDAIQRFIRRIELGVIPSVLDTVIFIRNGKISEILKLDITVKVPTGFTDPGLARPVIEVSDYMTGKVLYEIYEFGSNVVVTPVRRRSTRDYYDYEFYRGGAGGGKKKKKKRKKDESYESAYSKYLDYDDYALEEEEIYNPFSTYNNPDELEELYGEENADTASEDYGNENNVDGTENEEEYYDTGRSGSAPVNNEDYIPLRIKFGRKGIVITPDTDERIRHIHLFGNNNFMATLTLGGKGDIHISKRSPLYRKIETLLRTGGDIYGMKVR